MPVYLDVVGFAAELNWRVRDQLLEREYRSWIYIRGIPSQKQGRHTAVHSCLEGNPAYVEHFREQLSRQGSSYASWADCAGFSMSMQGVGDLGAPGNERSKRKHVRSEKGLHEVKNDCTLNSKPIESRISGTGCPWSLLLGSPISLRATKALLLPSMLWMITVCSGCITGIWVKYVVAFKVSSHKCDVPEKRIFWFRFRFPWPRLCAGSIVYREMVLLHRRKLKILRKHVAVHRTEPDRFIGPRILRPAGRVHCSKKHLFA